MLRILLIDDDSTLRRALRIALEKSGYEVVEAANGREGLAAFALQPADLVVTDIIMPEVEGVETIRGLRKASVAVPIIAISGGGRGSAEDYLYYAKIFGANRVFEKPFDIDTLRAAVASLLGLEGAASPA
jgi:DNA-binding response OmpR family regulator